MGTHDAPVKDVASFVHENTSMVVSGGWDAFVKFWVMESQTKMREVGKTYVAMPVHYMSC